MAYTDTIKVILISQIPLPYNQIGSWSTLYSNYFVDNHKVDIIICEKPLYYFAQIKYGIVRRDFIDKIKKNFFKINKAEYQRELEKTIKDDGRFVIQIIDNYGMVKPIHDLLQKMGLRKNCFLQFFFHGFYPYTQQNSSQKFYNLLDEIIVLTDSSYKAFKEEVPVLPNFFSILHNGINTVKFNKIGSSEKMALRQGLGFSTKRVFIWCSQDRPKKGLHIILDAWQKIAQNHDDVVLLIIGCEPKKDTETVKYLGRIPNDELSKFYQIADCYLFPTLWQEGFGLSLIEALHCGCYCIASKLGGVPEVLQWGKYGKLIDNPHFVEEWVDAITEFLEGKLTYPSLPKELYSTEAWNVGMNNIIEEAKRRLDNRTAP